MNKKSLSVYFSESLINDFKTALNSDLRYRNTSHFFELMTLRYLKDSQKYEERQKRRQEKQEIKEEVKEEVKQDMKEFRLKYEQTKNR